MTLCAMFHYWSYIFDGPNQTSTRHSHCECLSSSNRLTEPSIDFSNSSGRITIWRLSLLLQYFHGPRKVVWPCPIEGVENRLAKPRFSEGWLLNPLANSYNIFMFLIFSLLIASSYTLSCTGLTDIVIVTDRS